MIDMRHKPAFLPQISAPYTIVVDRLKEYGIENEMVTVNPDELKPMQGIVFSDEVGTFNPEKMNPIWIDCDNNIMDGHHRWISALNKNTPIVAIKLSVNGKDGARYLNKIQDIYEYEQQLKMEEVVNQNLINDRNSIDGGFEDDWLKLVEEDDDNQYVSNQITLIGYRNQPIKENSVIGDFFLLTPTEGYDKYEISFDNIYNVDYINDTENSINILCKYWFPNINFESLSKKHDTPILNLKNKAIAEKARKLGFDGIQYGTVIIQGLK